MLPLLVPCVLNNPAFLKLKEGGREGGREGGSERGSERAREGGREGVSERVRKGEKGEVAREGEQRDRKMKNRNEGMKGWIWFKELITWSPCTYRKQIMCQRCTF